MRDCPIRIALQENSFDVADSQPRERGFSEIKGSDAHHHSPRGLEMFVTDLHQMNHRLLGIALQNLRGDLCGRRGAGSMTETIHNRQHRSILEMCHHMPITCFRLPRKGARGDAAIQQQRLYLLHFLAVTVVPWPTLDSISNSSISLRTPGRPRPRLREVEKPP